MVSLGFMYEHGEGSNERAKEYYDQAALLGYAKAQYNLGCLYAIGNGIHHHCAKDLFKTKGKMKYNCILCRAKTPNTQEENFNYLRPWVKKKKAWAMTAMAQMYKTGVGTRQNSEMARRLYELSAEKDDAAALCNLGEMYHYALGLPQSYAKAIRYYERAAELGLLQASYNLGGMYANAEGVEEIFKKQENCGQLRRVRNMLNVANKLSMV
jgi:TPR repeat protein